MTRHKVRQASLPPQLRQIKIILLIVILVTALFGYQAVIYFDPLTILFRSLSTSILPTLDWLVSLVEKWLYQVPIFQEPITIFDGWIRPIVLPPASLLYRGGAVIGWLFIGIILLNRISSRFWCRYVCPLGGLLGLVSRLAFVKRNVDLRCKHCSRCDDHCPTGTIDPSNDFRSDPAECIVCLECLEDCPTHGTSFALLPGSIQPHAVRSRSPAGGNRCTWRYRWFSTHGQQSRNSRTPSFLDPPSRCTRKRLPK